MSVSLDLGVSGSESGFSTPQAHLCVYTAGVLLIWYMAGLGLQHILLDTPPVASERAQNYISQTLVRSKILLAAFCMWKGFQIVTGRVRLPDRLVSRETLPAIVRTVGWIVFAGASFAALQSAFMGIKTTIPAILPFAWDEMFRTVDLWVGLGRDPYLWLWPILRSPTLMGTIDMVYTLWIVLIIGAWMYAWAGRGVVSHVRHQYIIATLLTWSLLGNVAAILLSSAGPAYYGAIVGDAEAYAPLMQHLQDLHASKPLGAVAFHDVLWDMYVNPATRMSGISAMPSLHCASSLLLLGLFWRWPIARVLLIGFNVVIYVGSIVLAWHYAIDGIVSAVLVLGIWKLAGVITSKLHAA